MNVGFRRTSRVHDALHVASFLKPAQSLFHKLLPADDRTCIWRAWLRITALMRISLAKCLCSVVAAKGNMKCSVLQNLVHDPEIVHHFEAARLKTLALRPDQVALRLIGNPELHATAGKIICQRQAGRPGSCNQHLNIVAHHHRWPILLQ